MAVKLKKIRKHLAKNKDNKFETEYGTFVNTYHYDDDCHQDNIGDMTFIHNNGEVLRFFEEYEYPKYCASASSIKKLEKAIEAFKDLNKILRKD